MGIAPSFGLDATPADLPSIPTPGPWQRATVIAARRETPRARTFTLKPVAPLSFRPGQHCLVRLTAPDGYRAQRSYSIASAPGGETFDLTVELLPGGEVSTYLHDAVEPGDELDVRGPIGGYFAWDERPALGIGGGSGVVPLMSMLRHARRLDRPELFRMVVSVRRPEDLYYADEVSRSGSVVVYTRTGPAGSLRPPGHLTIGDLDIGSSGNNVYVCGSSGFCDAVTALLTGAGTDASQIRVERFGFSG